MNVPEKHREIAHAWVDGAEIERENNSVWISAPAPRWDSGGIYRIDPKCQYALDKIPEKHRETYLAWCDGAEIEQRGGDRLNYFWSHVGNPTWNTFRTYRIKPQKIQRWQWLWRSMPFAPFIVSAHMTEEEMHADLKRFAIGTPIKIPESLREDDE